MDLLLGIDMGTGSTKGVLVDASGAMLAVEMMAHSMQLPRPGWAEVDAEAAMLVVRLKTAKYTIERPLHLGAVLGGADDDLLARLSAVAMPLGAAFQLRDDVLGVFGDPATTGKPAGDDLVEGKRTVLVALALDGASAPDAARLDAALGRPLLADDVADLRRIIDASGAHAHVERVIDELVALSLAKLESSSSAEPARRVLRELAAAATDRKV